MHVFGISLESYQPKGNESLTQSLKRVTNAGKVLSLSQVLSVLALQWPWASWHLKSPVAWLFVEPLENIKDNTSACYDTMSMHLKSLATLNCCFFNSFFWLTNKKISRFHITGPLCGESIGHWSGFHSQKFSKCEKGFHDMMSSWVSSVLVVMEILQS